MARSWAKGYVIENRWQVHEVMRGGMGVVAKVYDLELHQHYAVKTFQHEVFVRSPEVAKRFMEEARAWVKLDEHPHVTRAYLVRVTEGRPCIFLEYVNGGNLEEWIRTRRPTQGVAEVLRLAIQFCDGMTHAVCKGILAHRDVKPTNCLLSADGTLKVTDFGLAKILQEQGEDLLHDRPAVEQPVGVHHLRTGLTRTGVAVGTPAYMAPEQFDDAKRVDERADIYSSGVMLYEMLTGELPFVCKAPTPKHLWEAYRQAHKHSAPRPLMAQYRELGGLVERCLAKDPVVRISSFAELRARLGEVYEALTTRAAPESPTAKRLSTTELADKAQSLLTVGQYADAIACCDRVLSGSPSDDNTWGIKAIALEKLGRFEEAIVCYDQSLETLSKKHKFLDSLAEQGRAFSLFGWRTQDIQARHAMTLNNKGCALMGLDRHDDAIECFDSALKYKPDDATAWNNKAEAFRIRGRSQDAIACCDRALTLSPWLHSALITKARALEYVGRYEEAVQCWEQALELNPHEEVALRHNVSLLHLAGRLSEAVAGYERLLVLSPNDPQTLVNKGAALGALRRPGEALTCFDRALALNPQESLAWNNKGVQLEALRRLDEAIECYERACAIGCGDARPWNNKGNVLRTLGCYTESLACYDRALELDPQYEHAWVNKGVALQALSRYGEALRCYEQALVLDPADEIAQRCKRNLRLRFSGGSPL
jgi:tetratricopeptide (TPR) repeat protein/tRNA A-37 threonylcarbamoyl transferase component Bud32